MLIVALFSVGDDWSFLRIKVRVYSENSHFYMYMCAPVCTLVCANEHNLCCENLVKEMKTLLSILKSLFSFFMTLPSVRCLLSVTVQQLPGWAPVHRDCLSPSAERRGACSGSRKSKFSDAPDQELTCNTASGSVCLQMTRFFFLRDCQNMCFLTFTNCISYFRVLKLLKIIHIWKIKC